ncbi:MAG: transporter [Cellulosimicrobium sp.]|nr:transporter [Cellulosimicrobium sp.]
MHLETDDLGHRFSGRPWLFRHLDTRLEPGRVYALTGPSGSGKSTLLSLLAGWSEPTEGSIRRAGIGHVGWVFQNPHGTPRRTALDHVTLPLLARGLSPRAAERGATELLERFALTSVATQEFRRLSGGEAQRLMLARAIAGRPGLLLVDEPTAQLDLPTARRVNTAIERLATDATIVVVATHDEHTRDACTDHIDLARFEARDGATA